ncbi:ATP-binding cassette domain-containing protein [Halotalea alkalilenta]|uniref:ATP-binding cassette domain-containing protein n=1 Tax=Halotalea alkalilenta TaxID=376489 RepID=UPI0004878DFE|nr:ATP-binding cassette domain-containing protein [Halotalea alkalilenta]
MAKLEVEGLCKRYGDHLVIDDVSFHAEEGEVISLIGASGSGKSTLLRCINFLERPFRGDIRLDGERLLTCSERPGGELVAVDARQLRRFRARLAMVFQSFCLWTHMSVLDNLVLPQRHVLGRDEEAARAQALAQLAKVGLEAGIARRYPERLSGGQQQRVAIARALCLAPEVLLFDEPTSALDPQRVGEVLEVMRALANERRTMLLVTHEMSFARQVSDRVLFLHRGRIEEQGAPEAVFGDPRSPRLRRLLGLG